MSSDYDENTSLVAYVQGRKLAAPRGLTRHVTQRFTAEVAPGPRFREMNTRLRSSEKQCSGVREDLQSGPGQAQS